MYQNSTGDAGCFCQRRNRLRIDAAGRVRLVFGLVDGGQSGGVNNDVRCVRIRHCCVNS